MWFQIILREGAIFGKGHARAWPTTICRELCKMAELPDICRLGCVDSGPNEACVAWGAHWRHLPNTTEKSMCGGDAAFLLNYVDHLFN